MKVQSNNGTFYKYRYVTTSILTNIYKINAATSHVIKPVFADFATHAQAQTGTKSTQHSIVIL